MNERSDTAKFLEQTNDMMGMTKGAGSRGGPFNGKVTINYYTNLKPFYLGFVVLHIIIYWSGSCQIRHDMWYLGLKWVTHLPLSLALLSFGGND